MSEARELLSAGRSQLASELVARGQVPMVSLGSIAEHSFRLKNDKVLSGRRLLELVRKALKPTASDESVVASALTMAGVFGEGDTMHFSGGAMHLIPFARVQEGIPELLSIERAVTMELVVEVHYWFVALGALSSADDLLEEAVPKIMEGRR